MNFLSQLMNPKAQVNHSVFDLSRRHIFSQNSGFAKPCLALETVPDDNFQINMAGFLRTQTFNTAAFIRGKQRFDFFFQPYSQIWHPFNQFVSQKKDLHTTRQLGNAYFPNVELLSLLKFIQYCKRYTIFVNGEDFAKGAFELLDMLGYGNFTFIYGMTDAEFDTWYLANNSAFKYVNIARLAAYQHVWYDYYRNKYYDDALSITSKRNFVSGGINTSVDYIFGFNFDDLDCSTFANSHLPVPSISATSDFANYLTIRRLIALLTYHRVQWKKDIFTAAMPSTQFGDVASINLDGVGIVNEDVPSSAAAQAYVIGSGGNTTPGSLFYDTADHSSWHISNAFNVLDLRKAELLQRWKQNALRAGNMVDANFEAHFGVKPFYESANNVRYLGSFDAVLDIQPVEATASTNGSVNGQVGDLAGKGTAALNGKPINVDIAGDYGVIICISSFLPESEYSSSGMDKANTLVEPFDFYQPEFENVGFDVVTLGEQDFVVDPVLSNSALGFVPANSFLKTAVDKVFGDFASIRYKTGSNTYSDRTGSLAAWVAPREDDFILHNNTFYKTKYSFYAQSSVFDNAFAVNSTLADQFLLQVFFDIKAKRPMSVLGIPEF